MNLKELVEQSNTPSGRVFDLGIQFLIILSIISFSVETLPNLNSRIHVALRLFETIAVIIFTAEYLLRFFVADKKLKFVFSFYGLIDLLAILPFYLSSGIDLRSIRILRLFRLFRAFKLLRYNRALERLGNALKLVRDELMVFLVACLFLIYLSSVGIYYFEHKVQPEAFGSVFHSMWWSVATLTTVGYGDVYPVTIGGRIFTTAILFLGLGIIAVPAGLFASALSKSLQNDAQPQTD